MTDKILRDAVKALIDFHDAPIEAKRNDVFVRRIEACRTALNEDPLSMSMFANKEDYQEAVSKQLVREPIPQVIFLAAADSRRLQDPDCLPITSNVLRNGGTVNGEKALPFIKLTPAIIDMIREKYSSLNPLPEPNMCQLDCNCEKFVDADSTSDGVSYGSTDTTIRKFL